MTKELKLEECVSSLLSSSGQATVSPSATLPGGIGGTGGNLALSSRPHYIPQHHGRRRHSKPTSLLGVPVSPYGGAGSGSRGSIGGANSSAAVAAAEILLQGSRTPPGGARGGLGSKKTTPNKEGAKSALQLSPNSTYAGQSLLITQTPKAMIRRNNSKNELRGGNQCTIRLLDDAEILQCDFLPHHKGQFIMDFVCRQLNIAEKDYFGLRFVDSNKQRHWLDLSKSIIKQLKDMAYIVCFRFKFYPNDPMMLKEEVSRYQLVLQLRRDALHGRLYSTLTDMAGLASFIVQSELGDYDPEVHQGNYISDYELVSRQTLDLEEKAIELHQKLKGITPSEADTLFLKKAATLDTYGIDPHPVKDQQGEQVYLGINHTGISTFQGSRKSTHFKWSQITKLNYEAKMFIIHLSIPEDSRNKKKETVGFKCQTSSSCKYLWRCAVEQRLFFTCGCAGDIPSSVRGGGIFGTRFRYSGRVQKEILEDPGPLRAADAVISRTPLTRSFQKNKTRSLPHTPLTIGKFYGYGSLPRSNHSAPPHESTRLEGAMGNLGSSTSLPLSTLSSPYCPEHTLPLLETLREDSPRVEEKVSSPGQEQLSRNLTTLLEKALDEKVEKEFLSTQEETLTSIPEDPETEADVTEELPKDEEDKPVPTSILKDSNFSQKPAQNAQKTSPLIISFAPTTTPTENKTEGGGLTPNHKMGKGGVGNGSAILNNNYQNGSIKNALHNSPEDNNNYVMIEDKLEKILKEKQKCILEELGNNSVSNNNNEIIVGKVLLESNLDEIDEEETIKPPPIPERKAVPPPPPPLLFEEEVPVTEIVEEKEIPNNESNQSAFVPVYNRTDGLEGSCLSPDQEKTLRESKIDQVTSTTFTGAQPRYPPGSNPGTTATPTSLAFTSASGSGLKSLRSPSSTSSQQSQNNNQSALISVLKVFLVCFICVLIALLLVAILSIEIDIEICQKMRRIPEVEIFQLEVYDPFKRFVTEKVENVVGTIKGAGGARQSR